MSFPACRHAKQSSATVTALRWLAAEPFRVFFLTGAIFSIAAVLLWPMLYAGWLPFHPGASHARLMVECFAGAFVVGFLGTAGPRMLSVPRLTPPEFCTLDRRAGGHRCIHARLCGVHAAHPHLAS